MDGQNVASSMLNPVECYTPPEAAAGADAVTTFDELVDHPFPQHFEMLTWASWPLHSLIVAVVAAAANARAVVQAGMKHTEHSCQVLQRRRRHVDPPHSPARTTATEPQCSLVLTWKVVGSLCTKDSHRSYNFA